MSNCDSLDAILKRQCETLEMLETTTELIKNRHVVREQLLDISATVTEIKNSIEVKREELRLMVEKNNEMKDLISKLSSLDAMIVHMEKNVPQKLLHDYREIESSAVKVKPEKKMPTTTPTPMKDCKKTLFNEPEVCDTISPITQEEFSKIPKYIIGRRSLDAVNSLITTINEIIQAKYTFLSLGKAHARKQGDLNLFLRYKSQEKDMTSGNEMVYFFTGEDYERHTWTKLNKVKLNLLVVLRHCKRIREWRSKNETRYVICTGSNV